MFGSFPPWSTSVCIILLARALRAIQAPPAIARRMSSGASHLFKRACKLNCEVSPCLDHPRHMRPRTVFCSVSAIVSSSVFPNQCIFVLRVRHEAGAPNDVRILIFHLMLCSIVSEYGPSISPLLPTIAHVLYLQPPRLVPRKHQALFLQRP